MEYKTSVFYAGGGSEYTFPFEYLQKSFVKVRYQKPDGAFKNLELGKDYNVEENRVTLTTASDSADKVNIYRSTPTDRMVKYVDASILKAHDMNVNELQTLHIMEEQTDYLSAYALFRGDNANVWEANTLRIINLATPLEPTDAVNKAYVDEYGVSWNQNVAQMKQQIQEQNTNIATQLDTQNKAITKQLSDQQTAIEQIHDDTRASAELSKKWAQDKGSPDNASDSVSSTGKTQSSKTWAGVAKSQAQASAASAAAALASQNAAKTSETNAKTSETNAKTSEENAAESARQAAHGQINADWNETNADSMAYIKNKPDVLLKSGGTMTGNTLITMGNGESYVRNYNNGLYLGGTNEDNASSLVLFTNSNASGFQLNAGDGTTHRRMVGKPDGTLTWDGQPLLPIGVVQAFAGSTIPTGWLLCDGSAVSRTDYAALYAVIRTTYGAGNGSTTFNLPNLTDRFIQGNSTSGTVKSAGLPNITGQFNDPCVGQNGTQSNGVFKWNANTRDRNVLGGTDAGFGILDFNASRSNSIYGKSSTVQPPALTMRYIIKY